MGHRRKPRQICASHILDPDGDMSAGELLEAAQKLVDTYGSEARVEFDAGYNNVDILVVPEADHGSD